MVLMLPSKNVTGHLHQLVALHYAQVNPRITQNFEKFTNWYSCQTRTLTAGSHLLYVD